MTLRFFSSNFFPFLAGSAAVATVGAGAWYLQESAKAQEVRTNRSGVTIFKRGSTQRERFDQYAGSMSKIDNENNRATPDAELSSSFVGDRRSSSAEKFMTIDEFIASFLPEGTLPPAAACDEGATSSNSNADKRRFSALTRLFHQLDADGDGVLSFSEYCALFCFISADDDMFKTAFTMFDENNSRTLDAYEFGLVLKALNPDPTASLLFAPTDTKKKGRAPPPPSSSLFQTFFGPKLDKNLSYSEFDKIVRRLRLAVQEAEFEAVDAQSRGELNATELRHLMFAKKFRGSQRKAEGSGAEASAATSASVAEEWANKRRETLRSFYREGDEFLTASKATYTKFCEIIRCSYPIMKTMKQFVRNKKRLAAESSEDGEEGSAKAEGEVEGVEVGLTQDEFMRAVAVGIQGRIHLTPREMDLFFALFDGNGNGVIEPSEFAELCRINKGFGAGYFRDFSQPKLSRAQQFQRCMMQRDE